MVKFEMHNQDNLGEIQTQQDIAFKEKRHSASVQSVHKITEGVTKLRYKMSIKARDNNAFKTEESLGQTDKTPISEHGTSKHFQTTSFTNKGKKDGSIVSKNKSVDSSLTHNRSKQNYTREVDKQSQKLDSQ